jgi:hypothetical protein
VRVLIQPKEEVLKIGANGYGAAGQYRENDVLRAEPTCDAPILVERRLTVEERSAAVWHRRKKKRRQSTDEHQECG